MNLLIKNVIRNNPNPLTNASIKNMKEKDCIDNIDSANTAKISCNINIPNVILPCKVPISRLSERTLITTMVEENAKIVPR